MRPRRLAYLLGLVKYIHRNPLRAKIAERLDAYAWSSHHAYTGKNNPLELVDTEQVLRLFSERPSRARARYREFMADHETLDKKSVYTTIDQRIQGDDEFAARVLQQHDAGIAEARKRKKSLEAIANASGSHYETPREELRSHSRTSRIARARVVFTQVARVLGYRGSEVARFLQKDPAAVTRYVHQEEYEKEVKDLVGKLERE